MNSGKTERVKFQNHATKPSIGDLLIAKSNIQDAASGKGSSKATNRLSLSATTVVGENGEAKIVDLVGEWYTPDVLEMSSSEKEARKNSVVSHRNSINYINPNAGCSDIPVAVFDLYEVEPSASGFKSSFKNAIKGKLGNLARKNVAESQKVYNHLPQSIQMRRKFLLGLWNREPVGENDKEDTTEEKECIMRSSASLGAATTNKVELLAEKQNFDNDQVSKNDSLRRSRTAVHKYTGFGKKAQSIESRKPSRSKSGQDWFSVHKKRLSIVPNLEMAGFKGDGIRSPRYKQKFDAQFQQLAVVAANMMAEDSLRRKSEVQKVGDPADIFDARKIVLEKEAHNLDGDITKLQEILSDFSKCLNNVAEGFGKTGNALDEYKLVLSEKQAREYMTTTTNSLKSKISEIFTLTKAKMNEIESNIKGQSPVVVLKKDTEEEQIDNFIVGLDPLCDSVSLLIDNLCKETDRVADNRVNVMAVICDDLLSKFKGVQDTLNMIKQKPNTEELAELLLELVNESQALDLYKTQIEEESEIVLKMSIIDEIGISVVAMSSKESEQYLGPNTTLKLITSTIENVLPKLRDRIDRLNDQIKYERSISDSTIELGVIAGMSKLVHAAPSTNRVQPIQEMCAISQTLAELALRARSVKDINSNEIDAAAKIINNRFKHIDSVFLKELLEEKSILSGIQKAVKAFIEELVSIRALETRIMASGGIKQRKTAGQGEESEEEEEVDWAPDSEAYGSVEFGALKKAATRLSTSTEEAKMIITEEVFESLVKKYESLSKVANTVQEDVKLFINLLDVVDRKHGETVSSFHSPYKIPLGSDAVRHRRSMTFTERALEQKKKQTRPVAVADLVQTQSIALYSLSEDNFWREMPNSESNVIYQTDRESKETKYKNEHEESSKEESSYRQHHENSLPTIVAASLNKLIERLTDERVPDLNFVKAFLVTYRSFSEPEEVLKKIIQRYHVPRLVAGISEEEFRSRLVTPIQLRVINVVKQWIDNHFYDFADDSRLLGSLRMWISNDLLPNKNRHMLGKKLLSTIEKRSQEHLDYLASIEGVRTSYQEQQGVPKNYPSQDLLVGNATSLFRQFQAVDIARQLTLIDHQSFRAIKTHEFLNQAWNKKKLHHRAKYLLNFLRRFNTVSRWVASLIVKERKLRGRVKAVQNFIRVAQVLRNHNNFHTLMSVISGLRNSAVDRLKFTISEISVGFVEIREDLEDLMNTDLSFKKFRTALHTANPPCIPYIGVFLTDLVFTEDGNPDEIEGLVNFEKRVLVHKIISEVHQYQQTAYDIEANNELYTLMLNLESSALDDDSLYELSLEREPRGASKGDIY